LAEPKRNSANSVRLRRAVNRLPDIMLTLEGLDGT
jgi:hypothetical protein